MSIFRPGRRQYRVRTGSHRSRLLAFFADNPDEELTYADIEAKLGIPTRAITKGVVRDMRLRNELESVHVIRLPAKGKP